MTQATLDDISSDAGHLYHLLDTMVDMVLEEAGAGGQGEWPRLSALLWVARDLGEKVRDDLEALPPKQKGGAT
ncbi:hypothetical protein SAMN02745157_1501 [Kaistia soli DSM 19436]|uniref:Uncharacterized protein n=1 Tax=Kaistia soli DSM 19436 TaxID=1122133 RepID=A0A1M4YER2_9HYPH|nr:hypothetical protein [Kaistia soli]SHF04225.1 hypothetical protein SAMN02745157_1501 [Kaistia soli DSM 19436]